VSGVFSPLVARSDTKCEDLTSMIAGYILEQDCQDHLRQISLGSLLLPARNGRISIAIILRMAHIQTGEPSSTSLEDICSSVRSCLQEYHISEITKEKYMLCNWGYLVAVNCYVILCPCGLCPLAVQTLLARPERFSSHSTGCLGRGEEKKKRKGKGERLWEIKHIFFALLHKSTIYCLWLCGAAKMLFAQPTDSISNSEEMVLLGIWYIVFKYI
jgi:hypothetical protein